MCVEESIRENIPATPITTSIHFLSVMSAPAIKMIDTQGKKKRLPMPRNANNGKKT
jgi:hypothetical protein